MKTEDYKPFKAVCKQTRFTETAKGESLSFMCGEEYLSTFPEVWPDTRQTICLIDHQGDEHFMDQKWFNEHFVKIALL